jgi:hypothetical protein
MLSNASPRTHATAEEAPPGTRCGAPWKSPSMTAMQASRPSPGRGRRPRLGRRRFSGCSGTGNTRLSGSAMRADWLRPSIESWTCRQLREQLLGRGKRVATAARTATAAGLPLPRPGRRHGDSGKPLDCRIASRRIPAKPRRAGRQSDSSGAALPRVYRVAIANRDAGLPNDSSM